MFLCWMVSKIMTNFILSIVAKCGSVKAIFYLRLVSFIESIFFPIPTDVLLAPMVLSGKHNWINISIIAATWSVLGGIVGYYLGFYFFDTIKPFIHSLGIYTQYLSAKHYFEIYGIIFLLIAAFTPVPYKVFTISAGVLSYNIFLFIIISLLGRFARFFLVSFICLKYGENILLIVNKYLLYVGILLIMLLALLLWV